MLNRLSDLVRLRTFANAQVSPVSRVDLASMCDVVPGDYVSALVEAAMPDGTYRVAIRDQTFLLRLPFAARAGDLLQLNVVAREPQMKFALAANPEPAEPAASLSETARFITALLDESEKLPLAATARTGVPLLAEVPVDGAEAAAALRDALAHSGIFYEAHQAQWIAGDRALATLMLEPQARLAPLRAGRQPAVPARTDAENVVVIADDTPRLPQLPVHRDALGMIKQQLDTLESRHIAWHGMIWQGQPLDWEVTEEPPEAHQSGEAPPWRTRLRLTLPRLGEIGATLLVAARGVTIALHAANAPTRSTLAEQRSSLQQSLRNAGVNPLAITVHRDEPA